MSLSSFSDQLRSGAVFYGAWASVPGPVSAGALASVGFDYVVIDLQHGGATEHDLPAMTAAIRLAGATPIGRTRFASPADIGRALDLGCEGVFVPNVETVAHASLAAESCLYPPGGFRSAGGILAGESAPFCFVMVESSGAMTELEGMLKLPGVDGIYVGPRDLSYSLGCKFDPSDPLLKAALERIWEVCAAAGKPVGVHATDGATARLYRDNGCRLVTVASDIVSIKRAATSELARARQD